MDNIIEQSATYQATTKNKSTKFWILYIIGNKSEQFLTSETWIIKSDGEESVHKFSGNTKVTGKNLGKANETTIAQQALLEFDAKVQKKIDEGYHLPGEVSDTLLLPQLAKTFDVNTFDKYPVVCQSKLDGIRAILTNGKFYSRKGKQFIPEICNDFLVPLPDGVYLDGELMLRGDYTFQETISAIKKYNPNTAKDLVYCVYDLYDKNRPDDNFDVRYQHLVSIVETLGRDNIELVLNYNADNKTEFLQEHQDFVDLGYEGTMVRLNAPYTPGHRSSSLLKHKDFVDAEYRIVDIVAGNGLYADCGMLVCVTDNGSTFNVSLADTLDAKRDVLKYPENYLGRWLKVKFQELTDSGIPRFPVGLGVRDAIEG